MNESYPDWWRKRLTEKLRDFGVNLVLGDYVDQEELSPDSTLRTRKGLEIKAELLVSGYSFGRRISISPSS